MIQTSTEQPGESNIGILLVNLGTPDKPTTGAVRRYLREFLWDPRVVEVPRPIWWLVLNGIILNTRPRHSAAAYRSIWTDEGSPLLTITQRQAEALRATLAQQIQPSPRVVVAMRYGNPSIAAGLRQLRDAGVTRVLVLPLYPQYSATTTASIFDAVTRELQGWRWIPELRFINEYHLNEDYIQALADSVRDFQEQEDKADRLLISFHGIPRDYADAGDPYPQQCQATARALASALGLTEDEWVLTFQSRLGRQEWLRPYTDETLQELGAAGTGRLHAICPGFATDCLETLEEIAIENRERFLDAGGGHFSYIPCLNDSEAHIRMLGNLVAQHLQGWTE